VGHLITTCYLHLHCLHNEFLCFWKSSSPGQVKNVNVIDRFLPLFCRQITQFLHGTYGNLWNRLYAFMIGYSVYPTGHPLIDNYGDTKLRRCFRRKRAHKLNCVGTPGTVLTLKVKSKMCSVKRACLFVMLHIALNMTTKGLNNWDFEPLE